MAPGALLLVVVVLLPAIPINKDLSSWQVLPGGEVVLAGGSCWPPGCWAGSCNQGGDEGIEQGLAASTSVMHELEEAE